MSKLKDRKNEIKRVRNFISDSEKRVLTIFGKANQGQRPFSLEIHNILSQEKKIIPVEFEFKPDISTSVVDLLHNMVDNLIENPSHKWRSSLSERDSIKNEIQEQELRQGQKNKPGGHFDKLKERQQVSQDDKLIEAYNHDYNVAEGVKFRFQERTFFALLDDLKTVGDDRIVIFHFWGINFAKDLSRPDEIVWKWLKEFFEKEVRKNLRKAKIIYNCVCDNYNIERSSAEEDFLELENLRDNDIAEILCQMGFYKDMEEARKKAYKMAANTNFLPSCNYDMVLQKLEDLYQHKQMEL